MAVGALSPKDIRAGSGITVTRGQQIVTIAASGGVGGGDNVTVNGVAVADVDLDDATPAAPGGSLNVRFQKDAGSPANVSANLPFGTSLTTSAGNLERAALTGDVTASAGSNSTTIVANAVSYAKMQDVTAASRLLGRGSAAGAGDPQELTLGTGLSLSGTVLSATATGDSSWSRHFAVMGA